MIFTNKDAKINYAPPILGNGEISFDIDYEGTQQFNTATYEGTTHMPPQFFWWAGRRYRHMYTRDLIPFGKFSQKIKCGEKNPKLLNWSQELNCNDAIINCECEYEENVQINTSIFVHHDFNLVAIKKQFKSKYSVEYDFNYVLSQVINQDILPEYFNFTYSINDDNSIDIHYEIDGQHYYKGIIKLFSNKHLKAKVEKNAFSLSGNFNDKEEAVIYMLFCDNLNNENFSEYADYIKNLALKDDFEELYKTHKNAWNEYNKEGYVHLDNISIESSYKVAQYHLKCETTKWSIPVGINNTHWQGKYFAFDEYFSYIGLLTSNHLELAKRVPEFRYKGLELAVKRASSTGISEARYPWETVETGEEAAIFGFWYEHIFHMAHISMGAWEYYLFSGDYEFLKNKSYPIILACAEFYMKHMIYKTTNGKTIVGACTDLERLGSSVKNAYMTTCSVIKTLNILFEAANILNVDKEWAADCKDIANELKDGLPHDGIKYVPYPNCKQKSIAVFSGTFPYKVIDVNNKMQENAMADFLENEHIYGNMYAVGSNVSSWYAGWKAVVFARLLKKDETYNSINQVVSSCGCFGEMYEINEPKNIFRPWFSTASGTLIHAVNEMLLQSDKDYIYIMPSLPDTENNIKFKLLAISDIIVEVEMQNLNIIQLSLSKGNNCTKDFAMVFVPNHISIKDVVKNNVVTYCGEDDKNHILKIQL